MKNSRRRQRAGDSARSARTFSHGYVCLYLLVVVLAAAVMPGAQGGQGRLLFVHVQPHPTTSTPLFSFMHQQGAGPRTRATTVRALAAAGRTETCDGGFGTTSRTFQATTAKTMGILRTTCSSSSQRRQRDVLVLRRSALSPLQSSSSFSSGDIESGIEGSRHSYQAALRRQQEESFRQFATTHETPAWMRRMSTTTTTTATATTSTSAEDTSRVIPFSCTGCGKCCQTIGSVYLSPDDVAQASKHLNLSPQQFIRTYASHTIQNAVKGAVTTTKDAATTSSSATTPWVVLRDSTNKEDAAAGASCIFLDTDTNQCQIYEARPAQCRTYPFWPSIVASVQDWNDECRRKGGDSDGPSYGAHNALLPEWTPEAGGCEGMRPIQIDPKNDDRWIAQDLASSFLSSSSSPPLSPSLSPESFTSTDEAIRCLYQYVQDHRRFPHGADEVPVSAAAPE